MSYPMEIVSMTVSLQALHQLSLLTPVNKCSCNEALCELFRTSGGTICPLKRVSVKNNFTEERVNQPDKN